MCDKCVSDPSKLYPENRALESNKGPKETDMTTEELRRNKNVFLDRYGNWKKGSKMV